MLHRELTIRHCCTEVGCCPSGQDTFRPLLRIDANNLQEKIQSEQDKREPSAFARL